MVGMGVEYDTITPVIESEYLSTVIENDKLAIFDVVLLAASGANVDQVAHEREFCVFSHHIHTVKLQYNQWIEKCFRNAFRNIHVILILQCTVFYRGCWPLFWNAGGSLAYARCN